MHLENPILFHLLWALVLQALMLYAYWRWRGRTLRHLGSPALEKKLLLGFSAWRFWLKNILFGLAMALVALALVNPYKRVKQAAGQQRSSDVIIAMDVSQSMLANDVAPDRLELSKTLVQKLAQSLEQERLGLVFFAGAAFPETPLSANHEALLMFVRNASPAFITDQGTSIDEAIQVSGRLFDPGSAAGRTLVLISDGENFGASAARRAREARLEGVTIHTICVGTPTGGKIPLGKGNFKRDGNGQVVQTRPDAAALREIAREGGGVALTLTADENAIIQTLRSEINRKQKTVVEVQAGTDVVSYFQWLIIPAIFLLALEQLLWWRKRLKQDG